MVLVRTSYAQHQDTHKLMDDTLALFLSLPPGAQATLRAAISDAGPANLRSLARMVYPYVQTIAEAQSIGDMLAAEAGRNSQFVNSVVRDSPDGKLFSWLSAPIPFRAHRR